MAGVALAVNGDGRSENGVTLTDANVLFARKFGIDALQALVVLQASDGTLGSFLPRSATVVMVNCHRKVRSTKPRLHINGV